VPDATFACPDLTTFCRLDELGLAVVVQRLDPDRAVLACRVVDPDVWCRRCGCQGVPRDSVVRRLAHEPLGWRPTTLEVTIRRYRCTGCSHVWRQDTTKAAQPRARLSRRGLRWALEGIVVQHLTVARVTQGLGVAWNTANDAVLAEGKRVLPLGGRRVKVQPVDLADGCPVCGVVSGRVHAWTVQRVRDVPHAGRVEVVVRKPRLVCAEPACTRRTFTPATPELPVRARCTTRPRTAVLAQLAQVGRPVVGLGHERNTAPVLDGLGHASFSTSSGGSAPTATPRRPQGGL